MPYSASDDATMPPPGSRSGKGAQSVLPYLVKSLATKPKAAERDDTYARTTPGVRRSEREDDEQHGPLDLNL